MRRSRLAGCLLTSLAVIAGLLTTAGAPAQAAVPDGKGWVLWNQPTSSTVAFGTWPPATTVAVLSTGRYQVTFPGQGAAGGVVHVTAVNQAPVFCQAETWFQQGTSEIAIIRCYQVGGGALVPTSFSAFFTSSSGAPGNTGHYCYVFASAAGGVTNQYNTAGLTNTVAVGGVGQYTVAMPGLSGSSTLQGGVQVTAVNATTAVRCKVLTWTSTSAGQNIQVRCHGGAGAAAATAFTVTFQDRASLYGAANPPQNFGYVLFQPPLGPAVTNFNSFLPSVGTNSVIGAGPFTVVFPQIGVARNTVQLTAYGPGPDYCNLTGPWVNVPGGPNAVANVGCYNPAGVPAGTGFTAGTSSQV